MHASRGTGRPGRRFQAVSLSAAVVAALLGTNELLSGQATFTARSAAVIVDVVTRDRQNRPILDLRKDEFEVFEDGKRQDITYFEPVGLATPGATTMAADARNAASAGAGPHRAAQVVLAFEQLSTEGRQIAAAGALKFLGEGLRPGDRAAVFAIDRALHFLVPYTLDREALNRGIDQAALRAGYRLEQPGRMPGAEWGAHESASSATTAESPYIRAHATIDALSALVKSLRAPEGRRVIVLFSEGLALGQPKDQPVNPSVSPHDRESWLYDNRIDAMDRLTKEAGREGVAFYTFDARGLRVANDPTGFGEAPYIGLKFLADETGGAFVEATSDLDPGIRRLAADLQSYYLLGYTSATQPDRRYRHIKVKVSRRDVIVLARRGYIADSGNR